MQLAAIATARFVAFIDTLDLNPRGKAYFPEIVPALVDRYGFLKFPQKLEDFDLAKGALFEGGRFHDVTVQKIQVFDNVLVVETASSTSDSETVLDDALVWASKTFGLLYSPGMIRRKAYVSQLTFYSDGILQKLNPALLRASQKLSTRVPEFFGYGLEYKPAAVALSYDQLSVKSGTAQFTIEVRGDAPFPENKYFSTAPLPTNEHIELLQELEADLSAS